MNADKLAGEYIVSDASTSVVISGPVGTRERKLGTGAQEPEIRFRVMPWWVSAVVNALRRAGVMSKSPAEDSWSGFGEVAEKGASVADNVDTQHKSRFGRVTRRRTEAL